MILAWRRHRASLVLTRGPHVSPIHNTHQKVCTDLLTLSILWHCLYALSTTLVLPYFYGHTSGCVFLLLACARSLKRPLDTLLSGVGLGLCPGACSVSVCLVVCCVVMFCFPCLLLLPIFCCFAFLARFWSVSCSDLIAIPSHAPRLGAYFSLLVFCFCWISTLFVFSCWHFVFLFDFPRLAI